VLTALVGVPRQVIRDDAGDLRHVYDLYHRQWPGMFSVAVCEIEEGDYYFAVKVASSTCKRKKAGATLSR